MEFDTLHDNLNSRESDNDNECTKNGAITLSRVNCSGYVRHETIFSSMPTIASCLVL